MIGKERPDSFAVADRVWTVVPDGCWVECPTCHMVLSTPDSCAHITTKRGEAGELLIRQSSGGNIAVELMRWR